MAQCHLFMYVNIISPVQNGACAYEQSILKHPIPLKLPLRRNTPWRDILFYFRYLGPISTQLSLAIMTNSLLRPFFAVPRVVLIVDQHSVFSIFADFADL